MKTPDTAISAMVRDLPPLILHPFNERIPPSALLENSKAALMLSGLMPSDGTDPEDLSKRLLSGRYSEIRMLYFLGKDVFRWLDQCVDWTSRIPELADKNWCEQSFALLLTQHPPAEVKEKLVRWGVSDYTSIFCRAIGLNTLFAAPPDFDSLSEEFLRNYHRYADALYACYLGMDSFPRLEPSNFHFCLYASGEYSRMLESAWEEGSSENLTAS